MRNRPNRKANSVRSALGVVSNTEHSRTSSGFRYSLVGLRWTGLLLSLASLAGCAHEPDGATVSAVVELTEASFHSEVMESDRPVLVEFWAPWCRSCLEMQPAIEQLARDLRGQVKVARLNIDEYPDTAASLGVNAPPVIIVFRDGKVIKRRSGRQNEHALRELISG